MFKVVSISSYPVFSVPLSRVSVLRKEEGTADNLSQTTFVDSSLVPSAILPRNTTPLTRSLMDFKRAGLCLETIVSSFMSSGQIFS